MKKQISFTTLLAFTVVTIILFACSTPNVALAASNDTQLENAYRAYFDFLQDELYNVGKPISGTYPEMASYPTVTSWINGDIIFAHLLDIDDDGIPELFYAKKLKNGANPDNDAFMPDAKMVLTYKTGKIISCPADYGIVDLDVNSYGLNYNVRITKDANGKSFVLDADDSDDSYIFRKFQDGTWSIAQNMYSIFIPDFEITGDIHIQSTTGTSHFYVDKKTADITELGRSVTYREFEAIKQHYMCGGDETITLNKGANTVLSQLEQYIPEYAQAYHQAYNNPASWAAPLVNEAIAAGVVPENLQVAYNRPITRAEFCALAVRYYESVTNTSITKKESFTDTSDENVQKMAGLGVVTGVGGGNFDPYATLTREQAATILSRLSAALDNPINGTKSTFSDNGEISSWALDAVGQMQTTGIMGGVGNNHFDPKSPYTKEQSIVTMKRMDSRLVPATGLTLVVGKSELKVPTGSKAVAYIPVGKYVEITPQVTPTNATDKTVTWSSSDENVAVKGRGVGAGMATITATTENGISASVVIEVRDNFVTDKLPLTVDCIYSPTSIGSGDFSKFKVGNDSRDAGSIQIIDVTVKSTAQDCDITVTGKVSRVREGLDEFYPYVKLVLKDYDGNVLAERMKGTFNKAKTGDDIAVEFNSIKIPDRSGAYTIEFVSDQGKTASDVGSDEPTIKIPELPFILTDTTVVEADVAGQKPKMVEVETMAISSIEARIENYNVKYNTYSASLICSGFVNYPYINEHMAPHIVSWKLVDSEGDYVDSGTFYAPDLEYSQEGSPQKVNFEGQEMNRWGDITDLKAGETYTLILSEG